MNDTLSAARYAQMFNGIVLNRCRDALASGVDPGTIVGTLLTHAAALHATVSAEPQDFLIAAAAALRGAERTGEPQRVVLPLDNGMVN